MERIKYKLDIDKCIIIGDFKRAKEGIFPIKNKLNLSIQLARCISGRPNSIYSRLYRYEKDGFFKKSEKLITNICKILRVTEDELVIKF